MKHLRPGKKISGMSKRAFEGEDREGNKKFKGTQLYLPNEIISIVIAIGDLQVAVNAPLVAQLLASVNYLGVKAVERSLPNSLAPVVGHQKLAPLCLLCYPGRVQR